MAAGNDAQGAGPQPEGGDVALWVPLVYEELRRIARRERVRLFGADTLATTALVNEAYAKLAANQRFESRGQFLRIAAVAMRRILIDRIRAHFADKRGGGVRAVALEDADDIVVENPEHVMEVNDALERLAAFSPRLAQVVECRFFAGYDEAQTAEALGTSARTVQRDWATARSWLAKELAH